jgi:hypothetical protein
VRRLERERHVAGGQQYERRGVVRGVRGAHVSVENLIERSRDDTAIGIGVDHPDRGRQPRPEIRGRRFEQSDVAAREDAASGAHLEDGRVRSARVEVRAQRLRPGDIVERRIEVCAVAGNQDGCALSAEHRKSSGSVQRRGRFFQRARRRVVR